MCIAILNTATMLDEETFDVCWYNNPDGGGLAYVEDGAVRIFKEMDNPERMYRKYVEIRRRNHLPMIVHFRIGTSGAINEENCHPFEVGPGLAVAHNGILDHVKGTPEINDTRMFIAEVLQSLPEGFLFNDGILQLMSGYIGSSKLVFLTRSGYYSIVNEDLGHWDKHHLNWYSNHSYEEIWETVPKSPGKMAALGARYFGDDQDESPCRLEDNWNMCASCENWMENHDLVYDHTFRALICKDCLDVYYEDLGYNSRLIK